MVNRIRSGAGKSRQQPRIGAPDPALTPNTGLAVITELCERLGVIEALDTAVGPIKQRERGFGAGELLCGIAAVQLAGEDFLTGLDRQRADAAGQQLTPVPGLASTTAAGLARRVTPAQWQLFADRSVLPISHRFSTVRSADRIYVLNEGYVVESGTHEELLAAGTTYAELFTLQASRTSSASPVRAPRVSQPLCVHERQAGPVQRHSLRPVAGLRLCGCAVSSPVQWSPPS